MYPIIILGAGASYDCIDREKHLQGPYRDDNLNVYRPPLLNQLFDPNRFHSFIKDYPEVGSLASDAIGVADFEKYLTDIEEVKALKNRERYGQLIALRFYLRKLFTSISDNYYRPVNYYRKLLNIIDDAGEVSCFVNFNYDLLLEKNINKIITSLDIDDYIAGNKKVIKIHGACNWFYQMEDDFSLKTAYKHFSFFAENFVKFIREERPDKKISIINEDISWNGTIVKGDRRSHYLPALAVPATTKANYVCPDSHIDELKRILVATDRILIIGWQANDSYLVSLITKIIEKPVKVTIVTRTSSQRIQDKLSGNSNLSFKPLGMDFSTFMRSEELMIFFS